jgi:glutathione S-transferase
VTSGGPDHAGNWQPTFRLLELLAEILDCNDSRIQALAQGLCDAGVALRWETARRPEALRYPPLAEGQRVKLMESYDFIEREVEFKGPLQIGQIALATALAWLEFRGLPDFVDGRPRLARWYREFCERPSMRATPYIGETHD